MLKNERTEDSGSLYTQQNSVSNVQKDSNRRRHEDGDTGGPPSVKSLTNRKKEDLAINMPEITSPKLFNTITAEAGEGMPDIIKQIRNSTPL